MSSRVTFRFQAFRAFVCAVLFMLTPAARAQPGAANARDVRAMSLEDLMDIQIQTVALHAQRLESAPAAVSVLTAEEIRKYGFRTLGEALAHIRGFYVTHDYTYYSVGAGGFQIPGDWATRILILVNGHAMTDNIFGAANYFGEDFIVDMGLVERIEVVRGTSSALYGSNGILATINVITRAPEKQQGGEARMDTGSSGERKLTLTQAFSLPKKMSLLASSSVFNDLGQKDLYLPEFNNAETNNGHALNMDGQKGYRLFANLAVGNWNILAAANSRQKVQPFSWAPTVFNDRGTRATDNRALIDAAYTRGRDENHVFKWRVYYDAYRFHGDYRYPNGDGDQSSGILTNHELDAGDWAGTQFSYRFPLLHGAMTAGVEGKFDLRALQQVADILPAYRLDLQVNKRDKFADGFVQQEWALGRHVNLSLGARYDWSAYRSSSLSPRAGIVYQPDAVTSLKFLYGRGFRNPNASELFFSDGMQNLGNPNLRPERADTLEVVAERRLARAWKAVISAYRVVDHDVIVQTYTDAGLIFFQNADQFHGIGIGAEVSGKVNLFEIDANFQQQKSYLSSYQTPANSPGEVGQFRAGLAVAGSKIFLSAGLLYQSERRTLANATLPSVYVPEATVTSRGLWKSFDFQAGVRNLSNLRYADPVGLVQTVDSVQQPGRTFFFALTSRIDRR